MRRFASLFSGCGGLDLGFVQAGYRGELAVDIDASALAVHKLNIASPVLQADLTNSVLPREKFQSLDVLLAGSPCQGFSTAGKRDINDPRNQLLYVVARVAAEFRPKVVVAENVPAVRAGAHKKYWNSLHAQLRGSGYATQDLLVDCSEHGVSQKRKRLFLIAWCTGKTANLELPKEPKIALEQAIAGASHAPNHDPLYLDSASVDFKIASRIGPGQKLTNSRAGASAIHTWHIPEVFGKTSAAEQEVLSSVLRWRRQTRRRDFGDADPVSSHLLRNHFGADILAGLVSKGYLRKAGHYHDLADTYNGKYRRPLGTELGHTVDTRYGDPKLFLHPTEHRGFTVREAARIQGFGDDFVFSGVRSVQFRMIGNAVPPPVAAKVGHLVLQLL